jgi:putative membrane protein
MANGSLSASMDNAVKRYSSLFKLPSLRRALSFLVLLSVVQGFILAIVFSWGLQIIWGGLLVAASLFLANFAADLATSNVVLNSDPVYDLKRTVGLSVFSWGVWLFFVLIGTIVSSSYGLSWFVNFLLLGFSAVLILRLIVFSATSFMRSIRHVTVSFLQPYCCLAVMLVYINLVNGPLSVARYFFLVFAPAIALAASYVFILAVNEVGQKMLGVPSMALLKAFLLNWIVGLNGPFESLLERLSREQTVDVSVLRFGSSRPKAVLAVPSVHPGPFKNIGSSVLPSLLKSEMEKDCMCVVCVPHGLLGHEYDLPSQAENQKVLSALVEAMDFEGSESTASPFVKISNGLATACCQIFGRSVFVSFTLAPRTIEDLPQDLGLFVCDEIRKRGFNCCVVVNAHNSLDGAMDSEKALVSLKAVALECLDKASKLRQGRFEVGAATVVPNEYGLGEGFGPGGITVVVVKVGEQKSAYVTFDGNNMVSGLREKILSSLGSLGVAEGEVFTTDTHSVSGIVLGQRGYHPVGEVMDHDAVVAYVREAVESAVSGLEEAAAGCRNITISDVKVIGEEKLATLCLLIDKGAQRAKRVIVPVLGVSGFLLMFFLMFS